MEEIKKLFREYDSGFTVFAVENKFATGRGLEYFKSFLGTPNFLSSNNMIQKHIAKIHAWIEKCVPCVSRLIEMLFHKQSISNIVEIINILNKIFGTQEHQAVGPDVIDPIIIQEKTVNKKFINHIINLYKEKYLSPAIIIILKDDNLDRALDTFSDCPHGMNIKFIHNDGKSEIHKVINTGANNIDEFIDAFSRQCFSTCSETNHKILLNEEWANNSVIRKYVPRILKYRSSLICDCKNEIKKYLNECIDEVTFEIMSESTNTLLLKNILCILKIYRIFCNDYGGTDLKDALNLANQLDNKLLLAYIYKYAFFMQDKTIKEQDECLNIAYQTFIQNGMNDNAIYCKNNKLVRQFDEDKIYATSFSDMIGEAMSNVPGLVGMSHLFNNTGLAYMMTANVDSALEYFDKGIELSKTPTRIVQRLALSINVLITKSYYDQPIEYIQITNIIKQIYDGMVYNKQLPFISARYLMNLLIIAMRQNKSWVFEIIQSYPVIASINAGVNDNVIGTGQLKEQIDYIDKQMPELNIKTKCRIPNKIINATGRRKKFIQNSGLNPFYFFTWL